MAPQSIDMACCRRLPMARRAPDHPEAPIAPARSPGLTIVRRDDRDIISSSPRPVTAVLATARHGVIASTRSRSPRLPPPPDP
jgi:hypothetical protein